MSQAEDIKLLRQYEPVMRFTQGEQFFPISVHDYVHQCSLWVEPPNQKPERLIAEKQLTLEALAQVQANDFATLHYLKFIEPLNVVEMARYTANRLKEVLIEHTEERFHPGSGRLARVGYISRFIDALFTVTLLARGRVRGDTAAAASQTVQKMLDEKEDYRYHGRVFHRDGWIVLQYWLFYPFNNWRSGFFGANDHEADWEMACVYLADNPTEAPTPEWVGYASHIFEGDDLRRRWDDPALSKIGDHPVIYAGAGSHASYYEAGEYMTEMELPFLAPLVRLTSWIQQSWRRMLRQAQISHARKNDFNIFKIPFIDYARGDGLTIGPETEKPWGAPFMLSPTPDWVRNYRGLWGAYVHDQISGENAPAGPKFNRDGSVRRAWYDPIGWAGLSKTPPLATAAQQTQQRAAELKQALVELRTTIEKKSVHLRNLGLEVQAMYGHPHLSEAHKQHRTEIAELETELDQLRARLTTDQAVVAALENHATQLENGYRPPPQAHLQRPHRPTSPEGKHIGRFAEIWSAISIALVLFTFVGVVVFARQYLVVALAIVMAVSAFVEASSRRRLTALVRWVTAALAVLSALVLLYEFSWQIMIAIVLISGIYIMWQNLRELFS